MQLLEQERGIEAAIGVVEAARAIGGTVRVLGGVAFALRCHAAAVSAPLARPYADVDLVVDRVTAIALPALLPTLGYRPRDRFNAMHGHRRLMFDRADGLHLDVFVDALSMCHSLPLAERLAIHSTTVSLADLALAKLQIADLQPKDIADLTALFIEHAPSADERGINLRYATDLLSRDWGWWRTVVANLNTLTRRLDERLSESDRVAALNRVDQMLVEIDRAPKTMRWRIRSKLGDRIPWREEPESM